ncbi:DUF4406 domain-containing protein [Streptomyces sp. IBSBF 2953]|jgi:hypothetical protein|nr:DUF4406 domain-containing protein [Streptomyces hayashii]
MPDLPELNFFGLRAMTNNLCIGGHTASWQHSKGARLEVLIAERLGMTVVNAHDLVTREAV